METVICKLIAQNALCVGSNSNIVLFYIASSEMLYSNLHPFVEKTNKFPLNPQTKIFKNSCWNSWTEPRLSSAVTKNICKYMYIYVNITNICKFQIFMSESFLILYYQAMLFKFKPGFIS